MKSPAMKCVWHLAILFYGISTRFHQCKVCSFRENWNFKIALYITIRRYTKIVISRKVLTLGWWNPAEMRYLAILRHFHQHGIRRSSLGWWNKVFYGIGFISASVENWNFKIALYITIRRYTKIVISRKVLTLGWWNPAEMRYLAILRHFNTVSSVQSL